MNTRFFGELNKIRYGYLCAALISLLIGMAIVSGDFSSSVVYAGPDETEPAPDPAAEEDPNFLTSKYINPAIRFMATIVGLVVVISIVIGGIQYASSEDDPQKVTKAKARIFNSILGLLAFLFLYSFLEWLIPGGFL